MEQDGPAKQMADVVAAGEGAHARGTALHLFDART